MQPITNEKIQHLASLARIAVEETACAALSRDLADLVALADQLEPLPMEKDVLGNAMETDELRADEVKAGLAREQLLAATRDTDGIALLVPRTVEE